jgi:hypothetical protein|mmetsp:Transcript_64771/g.139974  ORF Transcript_64771/g.139974 Transcript_64771/m.139974 type:complete len:146 (+) Transcript_64771:830-1267(+)
MRLIAVLKESRINKDGSSEAEAFLKYFPGGEVFVDEERLFYKALGKRSFWALLNGRGLSFIRQRLAGIGSKNVRGNFNGIGADGLLLGGSFLITPSGRVVWAHKEGDGPIPLELLQEKLQAFASDDGPKTTPQNDWLQQAFDLFR